ncbi:MAG: hypothetical protein UT55_C0044G0007 [Candidatus Peregrinibacteria bacterium GW2011_GWE2_39_6]|nr:MAG: hypothetical protein UT36_C0001G0188 [Candidatus Peregrinibacteria bacterium GW2011_GWF2_39_17]KKR25450.1 MAG: hypothetical protein UT55_C0044G0007 [Candidatus Peregrinibacteria bacterium GW2011_GWE2_39_6]HCW32626.1 hypothetical protein [Candidatus Peregrinibacteria bacterium]
MASESNHEAGSPKNAEIPQGEGEHVSAKPNAPSVQVETIANKMRARQKFEEQRQQRIQNAIDLVRPKANNEGKESLIFKYPKTAEKELRKIIKNSAPNFSPEQIDVEVELAINGAMLELRTIDSLNALSALKEEAKETLNQEMQRVRKDHPELSRRDTRLTAWANLGMNDFERAVEEIITEELAKNPLKKREGIFGEIINPLITLGVDALKDSDLIKKYPVLLNGFKDTVEQIMQSDGIKEESVARVLTLQGLSFGPMQGLIARMKSLADRDKIPLAEAEERILNTIIPTQITKEQVNEYMLEQYNSERRKLIPTQAREELAQKLYQSRAREHLGAAVNERQAALASDLNRYDEEAQRMLFEMNAGGALVHYGRAMAVFSPEAQGGGQSSAEAYEQLMSRWGNVEFTAFPGTGDARFRETSYWQFGESSPKEVQQTLWQIFNDYVPPINEYAKFTPPDPDNLTSPVSDFPIFNPENGPHMTRAQLVQLYSLNLYKKMVAAELIKPSGELHEGIKGMQIQGKMVRLIAKGIGKDDSFFRLDASPGEIQKACFKAIFEGSDDNLRALESYERELRQLALRYWPSQRGGPRISQLEADFPLDIALAQGVRSDETPILVESPVASEQNGQVYRLTWLIPKDLPDYVDDPARDIQDKKFSFACIEIKKEGDNYFVRSTDTNGKWPKAGKGWEPLSQSSIAHVWQATHYASPLSRASREEVANFQAEYQRIKSIVGQLPAIVTMEAAKEKQDKVTITGTIAASVEVTADKSSSWVRKARDRDRINRNLDLYIEQATAFFNRLKALEARYCHEDATLNPLSSDRVDLALKDLDFLENDNDTALTGGRLDPKDDRYKLWDNLRQQQIDNGLFLSVPVSKGVKTTVAEALADFHERVTFEKAKLLVSGLMSLKDQAQSTNSLGTLGEIQEQAEIYTERFAHLPDNAGLELNGVNFYGQIGALRTTIDALIQEKLGEKTRDLSLKLQEAISTFSAEYPPKKELEFTTNYETAYLDLKKIKEGAATLKQAFSSLKNEFGEVIASIRAHPVFKQRPILESLGLNSLACSVKTPKQGGELFLVDDLQFSSLVRRGTAIEVRDIMATALVPSSIETYGDLVRFLDSEAGIEQQVKLAELRVVLAVYNDIIAGPLQEDGISSILADSRSASKVKRQQLYQKLIEVKEMAEALNQEPESTYAYISSDTIGDHKLPWADTINLVPSSKQDFPLWTRENGSAMSEILKNAQVAIEGPLNAYRNLVSY